jgi:hypothetical protein
MKGPWCQRRIEKRRNLPIERFRISIPIGWSVLLAQRCPLRLQPRPKAAWTARILVQTEPCSIFHMRRLRTLEYTEQISSSCRILFLVQLVRMLGAIPPICRHRPGRDARGQHPCCPPQRSAAANSWRLFCGVSVLSGSQSGSQVTAARPRDDKGACQRRGMAAVAGRRRVLAGRTGVAVHRRPLGSGFCRGP